MGDAISAAEPSSTHGASFSLPFSEHEVVDDERAIGLSEEFAQADDAHMRITSIKVTRTFFKIGSPEWRHLQEACGATQRRVRADA